MSPGCGGKFSKAPQVPDELAFLESCHPTPECLLPVGWGSLTDLSPPFQAVTLASALLRADLEFHTPW